MATLKEFTALCKDAENQINAGRVNPFNVLNKLNKLAAKNDFCDNEAIKPVSMAFREYCAAVGVPVNKRYAFSLDIFLKDKFGRFTYEKSVKRHNGVNNELFEDSYFSAVDFSSEISLFRAIKYVVGGYMKESEREAKEAAKVAREAEKAEKRAQREAAKEEKNNKKAYKNALKPLQKDFVNGAISAATFEAMALQLKAQYNIA